MGRVSYEDELISVYDGIGVAIANLPEVDTGRLSPMAWNEEAGC